MRIITFNFLRQDMIDEFNTSEELFIFIISTKAGGMVLFLTSYGNFNIIFIFFSNTGNKFNKCQCGNLARYRL